MNIVTKLTNKTNYKTSNRTSIKYIVIHYTSNKGDTAKNNADYFARVHVPASAHYFVDEHNIYQSVLDKDIAWHCGTKGKYYCDCRNTTSIGVEICMNDKRGNVRQGSIDNSVGLVKHLMKKYNVPLKNVIRHYDVTHKNCPAPMVQDCTLWTWYKNKLVEQEDDIVTQDQFNNMMNTYLNNLSIENPSDWSKDARSWAENNGIVQGDDNGNKKYKSPCTREMMVEMLYRAYNVPT